ncbi:hypothetical protein M9978_08360 [Sphingomonas sp. MG17]|uniref:Uncharacterized protein n=1 Tax=Sphingomonas tagetis TaxID=2949092 RepID=A0A9X2HRA1_9SPHN|nr:hypothetical protein [Sphingomonas tagetis]MCP3730440.1 hypothetical protein [Sphingomonas tagetis]
MAAGAPLIAAQAAMQLIGGIEERGQLRGEARALDENARVTETQGAYDAVDALRAARMQQGEDITAAAAGGASLTGSIGDMLFQQAVEYQYQAMSIRAEAGMRAQGLRQQAQGKRRAGDAALFGGVLRAGASAIEGVRAERSASRLEAAEARGRASALAPSGSIPVPRQTGPFTWSDSETGKWGGPARRSQSVGIR